MIQKNISQLLALVTSMSLLLSTGGDSTITHAVAVSAVDTVYAACVNAMVRQTCSAMNDKSALAPAPANSVIFVAGVGQINAQAYNQIRTNGEAMCSTIKQTCQRNWNDLQCQTARALFK